MEGKFNAKGELHEIRQLRKMIRKKKRWGTSKLDRYLGELVALSGEGATQAEMQLWLRKRKRVKCSVSAISRFLKKHTKGQESS